MSIKVVRDFSGVPTLVEIRSEGRTYKVTYDQDKYTFSRTPTPQVLEMLKLVYPFQKDAVLKIPEPLNVQTATGGKAILFDDMETLLKWLEISATVAVDATRAYNGSQSLHFTAAPGGGLIASGCRSFPMPASEHIEVSMMIGAENADLSYFRATVEAWNTTERYTAGIRYDRAAGAWQYYSNAGAWTTFFTAGIEPLTTVQGYWHRLRFSYNLKDRKYEDFQIDNFNIGINQNVYVDAQPGSLLHARLVIVVDAVALATAEAWVDDVMVTDLGE